MKIFCITDYLAGKNQDKEENDSHLYYMTDHDLLVC